MNINWEPVFSTLKSFLPPFFGVLFAFLIDRLWTRHKDRGSRKKLKQELKDELTRCSNLLVGKGNLLPVDIWKSSVFSGSLKLLKQEFKLKLASIYFNIDCHNYTAEKVWDAGMIAKTTKSEKPMAKIDAKLEGKDVEIEVPWTYPELVWNTLSVNLKKTEDDLKKEIEDLLSQDSWN
ncbi:MAG: hypothetical protein PVI43_05250 [Candidatus Bathyarchaeota archaeon]|jgi:hypothetical protein